MFSRVLSRRRAQTNPTASRFAEPHMIGSALGPWPGRHSVGSFLATTSTTVFTRSRTGIFRGNLYRSIDKALRSGVMFGHGKHTSSYRHHRAYLRMDLLRLAPRLRWHHSRRSHARRNVQVRSDPQARDEWWPCGVVEVDRGVALMLCPHCRADISRLVRSAIRAAQIKTGSQGGKAGTGASKRRNVDYAELSRMGVQARKAKAHGVTQ